MGQETPRLPLAISMGEPAGIGTEVLIKAYAFLRSRPAGPQFPFYLIDDPARLAALTRAWGLDVRAVSIEEPAAAADAFRHGLPVLPLADIDLAPLMQVKAGQPSAATADAVTGSIRRAVHDVLRGDAAGVVTLPIQKAALQQAGFEYPGHTEYLGALTAGAALPDGMTRGPVMMLAAGNFRAVPVTIHMPLRAVPDALTKDEIVRVSRVTAEALRRDFGIAEPRLAVCGLNPHAGEAGRMGTEEADVILPAIEELRRLGVNAAGPFPGDTMFHDDARRQYDVAIAMYHDQALIPIKTFSFHEAVNVTLGLPIVRTSPDHGTGLAIAGKGAARPDSTIAAILLAAQMAEARARA